MSWGSISFNAHMNIVCIECLFQVIWMIFWSSMFFNTLTSLVGRLCTEAAVDPHIHVLGEVPCDRSINEYLKSKVYRSISFGCVRVDQL